MLLVVVCIAATVFQGAETRDRQFENNFVTIKLSPAWVDRLPPSVGIVYFFFVFLVPLSIESGPTVLFGRTVGKCLVGIKVVGRRADSKVKTRVLFRALFKWSYLFGGICSPLLLAADVNKGPAVANIVSTSQFQIAIITFNIVMLVFILGLHRKDRLGIHDQIFGTRLVRSDC